MELDELDWKSTRRDLAIEWLDNTIGVELG